MQADDLSRWALAHPEQFDAGDLRCWRIGSDTWLALADERLEPVGTVQRPVGLFVVPALYAEGWQLMPVLSLDAIRLVIELGGRLDRDLCAAVLPIDAVPALLERVNVQTLHAGPKECLDSAGQLAQSSRGSCASRSARACRRTSATAGAGCWSRGKATSPQAGRRSASCGCGS